MVRVCACVKDRGGTVVWVNKLVGGFRACRGVWVEVAVGSCWDWMEFGMVNDMVLFFPLSEYSLWLTAVHSAARLWKMKVCKGQL